MKRTILVLINLILINYSIFSSSSFVAEGSISSKDSIKILSTPDLYDLSLKWVSEYSKKFPDEKISVISVPFAQMKEHLLQSGCIGFVTGENTTSLDNESTGRLIVARDVIVPVVSAENPLFKEIAAKGISPEILAGLFKDQAPVTWGALLKSDEKANSKLYIIDDESVMKSVAGFMKTDPDLIPINKLKSAEDLLSAIQNDPYAIGFCRLVDIMDADNKLISANIALLPIDRNGNGSIDFSEDIYSDLSAFTRGVWIGKYPRSLFYNIYTVSSFTATAENEAAFIKWILTDGQIFLYDKGYTELLASERQTSADKLFEAQMPSVAAVNNKSIFKTLLFLVAVLIVLGLAIDAVLRMRRRQTTEKVQSHVPVSSLDENNLVFPKGIYFDKTHTWAFMEQSGIIKTGIDDFLQHVTGPLTRIRMRNEGEHVTRGEVVMSIIQNGKQLNIYSPVSGIIKECNHALDKDASFINSSPYNEGWIYKIEPSNWSREHQLLFMSEKQNQFIKNELIRLKDFLSDLFSGDEVKLAPLVLQDGGAIVDNTLSGMGPEAWEEFQTKFIDTSRQVWFYEII